MKQVGSRVERFNEQLSYPLKTENKVESIHKLNKNDLEYINKELS